MSVPEFTERLWHRTKGDIMKLIVCLDNRNGMLFAGRRQSSDRCLTERICSMTKDKRLWLSSYSAPLFEGAANVCVDEDYLQKAQASEYCFAEKDLPAEFISGAEEIIVFRWNRHYPADVRFRTEHLQARGKVKTEDFPGNSHENITMEVYR